MNPDIKKKWVAALRSNRYSQNYNSLRISDDKGELKYCVLGVLYDVCGATWEAFSFTDIHVTIHNPSFGHQHIEEIAGISRDNLNKLVKLNDHTKLSFAALADIITEFF